MKIEEGKSLWFPDCIERTLIEYHITEVSKNTVKAETNNENVEEEIEVHLPENPKSGHMKAAYWGYTLFSGKTGAQHFLDTHDPFAGYTDKGKKTIVALLMEDSYCKYWLRRCKTGICLMKIIQRYMENRLRSSMNIEETNQVLEFGTSIGVRAFLKGSKKAIPVTCIQLHWLTETKREIELGNKRIRIQQATAKHPEIPQTTFYRLHRAIEFQVVAKI